LPQALTYAIAFTERDYGERQPYRATDQPIGRFTASVCMSCGRANLYVAHPDEIPIGVEYATEVVEVGDADSPYR